MTRADFFFFQQDLWQRIKRAQLALQRHIMQGAWGLADQFAELVSGLFVELRSLKREFNQGAAYAA